MTEEDDDITLVEKKGYLHALIKRRVFLADTGQTDPDKSDPRMTAACTYLMLNEGEIDNFDRDMIVQRWMQRLRIDSRNVEGARLAACLGIDAWESISRKTKLLTHESRLEKITESADFLIRRLGSDDGELHSSLVPKKPKPSDSDTDEQLEYKEDEKDG